MSLVFAAAGLMTIPLIFYYGRAPTLGGLAVLASIIPLVFINHVSATYVTRLCLYLPTFKKSKLNNTDVFDPYKLDKSGNPSLYFETLGFFGNRVKTLIKLNELVDVSRDYKFQYITWKFNG
ncbi:19623_t:CDS:2 [Entrophospora sp. SA101]|nr:15303_t:CDS:2 [Entrophospora sp. SA101]CAJ0746225.1 19623_t:CDS:2 [Entrophospora sp. SA101]CAJ0823035.1 8841_t:CDS:2 [Entrophospora sp. SA101]